VRRRSLAAVAAACLVGAVVGTAARAGEIVTSFVPGQGPGREVLAHVEVKGLVAEFLDPEGTGLGKALGYLLWRELLSAVSDQAGAGVILARPPGSIAVTDLLLQDYHRAAVEIARSQHARLVLWGLVQQAGDQVYVTSHLTLLPEAIGADLQLSIQAAGMNEPVPGFTAELARSRYNFQTVVTTRERLFHRPVVARGDTPVTAQPAPGSSAVGRARAGEVLLADGMEAAWFRVRLPDGTVGWVENSRVDVPPREVRADRDSINVRAAPGGAVLETRPLRGAFRVLDQRYVAGSGSWYRLDLGGRTGWVAAWLVEPRFSLPEVSFAAGLLRYQRRNFAEAERAFRGYLGQAGSDESAANLSAAHQFVGASLLNQQGFGNRTALEAMDRAAALTPFDPAVYNLRALARLGVGAGFGSAAADVGRALELDTANVRSRTLLTALDRLAAPPAAESETRARIPREFREVAAPTPEDAQAVRELTVRHKLRVAPR
jgi:hypothetical protein